MGLNNIKQNDYFNVVIQARMPLSLYITVINCAQAIVQVQPFRDFFLNESNYVFTTDPLVTARASVATTCHG